RSTIRRPQRSDSKTECTTFAFSEIPKARDRQRVHRKFSPKHAIFPGARPIRRRLKPLGCEHAHRALTQKIRPPRQTELRGGLQNQRLRGGWLASLMREGKGRNPRSP